MLENSQKFGCMILGCIGNDSYGNKLQVELSKVGVKPLLEIRDDYLTSRCGVGIHLKERCLVPEIRASTMLSTKYVEEHLESITDADILFIEGYFVIERYDIILSLSKHFHSLGKKVAFTLSATFMISNFYDRILEISNQSHLIFCNSEEAELFSGLTNATLEEVSLSIHQKLQTLDRILIITDGSKPVCISRYDPIEKKLDFVLKSFVYPVNSSDIVDTNGCGDSWVGGFLSQYIQGKSIEKCARAGNWASSVIIRNVGCTFPDNMEIPKF
jgi:adenosine kinase